MSEGRAWALLVLVVALSPSAWAAMPKALQADAGQEGDASDARAGARVLPALGSYRGELAYPQDNEDWYAVDVPGGMVFAALLDAPDGGAVELWAPDASEPTAASGPAYGTVVRVDVPHAPGGRWHVRVAVHGPAEAPYVVTLLAEPLEAALAAPVVVATFDTGTNPFHPCWRRSALTDPGLLVPGIPADARSLTLEFRDSYEASRTASQPNVSAIADRTLYHVSGTSLLYYGESAARAGLVDAYPHGAMASSQIGCPEYGLGANALVVVLNWYQAGTGASSLVRWAADQPWIDVLHLNVQDTPRLLVDAPEVRYAVGKGKLVVVAAGNGVAGAGAPYPSELSRYDGPTGVLIAGANDNGGYTLYSNLDPDVVMDGEGTLAAAWDGFGDASFGGTSSASARVAGYVARVVGELRHEFGHAGGGMVTVPAGLPRPASGPLADGVLHASELHEVVRKTADPNPHGSRYDGATSTWRMPGASGLPVSVYAKMGYGEVSEETLPLALAVAAGREPMPERPVEDAYHAATTAARRARWG